MTNNDKQSYFALSWAIYSGCWRWRTKPFDLAGAQMAKRFGVFWHILTWLDIFWHNVWVLFLTPLLFFVVWLLLIIERWVCGSQEYNLHRQRVYETLNINKGLFSLKRVIEALHQRCRMAQEGVPTHALPYVPYQDSKLTMLLQEALGGSARTLIITTVTMDPSHAEESLQTLRFAETCAQVQKRREADQAASITLALDKIEQEIQALQADIAQKERWETRFLRRQDRDTVAGAFGEGMMVERTEVVPTSVLVGAEAEREQLEALLERQAELKGLCSMVDFGKDYRSMRLQDTKGATDGGRGEDFRAGHFSARTKAKDFEDEAVLADALRFLFRSCKDAERVFGELKARTRLQRNEIPEGYHKAARAMREHWEDQVEKGQEHRSFGKAMLDRCTAWRGAFKHTSRDAALSKLVQECGLAWDIIWQLRTQSTKQSMCSLDLLIHLILQGFPGECRSHPKSSEVIKPSSIFYKARCSRCSLGPRPYVRWISTLMP